MTPEIRAAWDVLWQALAPWHFRIGFFVGAFLALGTFLVVVVLSR